MPLIDFFVQAKKQFLKIGSFRCFDPFTPLEFGLKLLPRRVLKFFSESESVRKFLDFERRVNIYINIGYKIVRVSSGVICLIKNNERYLLRIESSDLNVFDQVIINKEYGHLSSLIDKCDLKNRRLKVIDCGSNIGLFSLWLLYNFKIEKIFCFEADSKNFEFQNLSIERLDFNSMVKSFNLAIWPVSNQDLFVTDSFRDGREWARMVTMKSDLSFEKKVKSICLNNILNLINLDEIHLLKIDIEGAEKEVFENDSSFDKLLNFVSIIAIEIHDEVKCDEMIRLKLLKFGFTIETIGETTYGYKLNG